jgi:hypothetical protein
MTLKIVLKLSFMEDEYLLKHEVNNKKDTPFPSFLNGKKDRGHPEL